MVSVSYDIRQAPPQEVDPRDRDWLDRLQRIYPGLPSVRKVDLPDAYVSVMVALHKALRDQLRLRRCQRVRNRIGLWPTYNPASPSLLVLNIATLRWASRDRRQRRDTQTIVYEALKAYAKQPKPTLN